MFVNLLLTLTPVAASPWNVRETIDFRGSLTQAPVSTPPALQERQANEGNTCGYASGLTGRTSNFRRSSCRDSAQTNLIPASPITCPDNGICATNTYFGVHGCCAASILSVCTIATQCIASSAMSTACMDDACSSDSAISKCTESTNTECYRYLFDYGSTIMVLLITCTFGARLT